MDIVGFTGGGPQKENLAPPDDSLDNHQARVLWGFVVGRGVEAAGSYLLSFLMSLGLPGGSHE